MDHEEWLNNEYKMWVEALQVSTVNNFKENLMVKRMLGDISLDLFGPLVDLQSIPHDIRKMLFIIDTIGTRWSETDTLSMSGTGLRMIYYAQKVLAMKPTSIIEIGGGVGEFWAILGALGYKGIYKIYDLPEVEDFQNKYIMEVERRTGLQLLPQGELFRLHPVTIEKDTDLCVSFYALGEFTDEMKLHYFRNVISRCKHGLIIWNPHSGASKEIPFECSVTPEYPLTHPDNLQLIW